MTLRSLFTAGALVAAGLLAGRLLGLLREMLLASAFGAGPQADTAILLLMLPDYITGALLGGALGATLVPAFAARPRERAIRLMWQVLLVSVCGLSLVGLALFGLERAGGYLEGRLSPALFLLFLLSLPFTAVTAIMAAWLQFRRRFMVIGFANAMFNAVIIAALWALPAGLALLAAAIAAAALVRMAAHVAAFRRAEGALQVAGCAPWVLDRPLLRHYAATASTGMIGMVPQCVPYIIIAAMGGGVAVFNYAFKLIIMPATLGQSVVQMVLLPWLVSLRGSAAHDAHQARSDSLQMTWLVSLALCLALMMAGHDIAALFFGYGKMTADDVAAVAAVFQIGVWAVPGMWLTSVWQQFLYAAGNARAPLVSGLLLAVLVTLACVIGQWAQSLQYVVFLYALAQPAPVVWLAREGVRSGMTQGYVPSPVYGRIALFCVAAWMPLAIAKEALALSALPGFLFSAVTGVVTLAAGACALAPVRQRLLARYSK